MELALGHQFRRIDISRLLEEVADDIRQDHVGWIDELNRRNSKSMEWWFGAISSRDIHISNLFQYCCYLEILERLRSKQSNLPELIVIESIGLSKAIKKWAKEKDIFIEVINCFSLKQGRTAIHLMSFLRWGKFAVTLLLRWMAAQISKRLFKPKDLKITPSVILDTFIHDHSLSNDGSFNNRYSPDLDEYLKKKGMHILVHPMLYGFRYNYFSILKKMRRSTTFFIIREDFLRFSDYLSALMYPLLVLRQKIEVTRFLNFDVSDVILEEQRTKSVTSGLQSVLIYLLFLRLGQSGLNPKLLITWYENQNINKAVIAGARKGLAQTKIIGTQTFILSSNRLSLFPSQSEVEAQVVPHLLLETSQYQCQRVQAFTKEIPCQSAAALRFAHLFNDECVKGQRQEQKGDIILVLLPYDIQEAVELMTILKEGLDQIKEDVSILIKGHPDYDAKTLINAFGKNDWPKQFEVFQGNITEALNITTIVVSSNTSSMVEAATRGIPVIFLGRQTVLNNNYLSNLDMDISVECFSTSELIKAINEYLCLTPEKIRQYREIGYRIRDLFFTPINEETMMPFLGIEVESDNRKHKEGLDELFKAKNQN
jgi:hypothetical protein